VVHFAAGSVFFAAGGCILSHTVSKTSRRRSAAHSMFSRPYVCQNIAPSSHQKTSPPAIKMSHCRPVLGAPPFNRPTLDATDLRIHADLSWTPGESPASLAGMVFAPARFSCTPGESPASIAGMVFALATDLPRHHLPTTFGVPFLPVLRHHRKDGIERALKKSTKGGDDDGRIWERMGVGLPCE
jgi:hypothetical protein